MRFSGTFLWGRRGGGRIALAKKGVCEYNVKYIARVYGNDMDFNNLQILTRLDGVSGREGAVRRKIASLLPSSAQNVRTDALGNLLAFVPGSGPRKIILCAHMDEVGLLVKYVSSDGFLSFVPVGGIDPRTLLAQRVTVHTAQGPLVGVIGVKPAHITQEAERGRAVPVTDLFIDVGLCGPEAARRVRPGDFVALRRSFEEFGDGRICSKALDDRVGCFCILEALRRVPRPVCGVHVLFSCQEEVGLRGAGTAAYGLDADLALAVDATGAADIPLCSPRDYIVRLGGGVAVTALDAATITPQWLFDGLTDLCKSENIMHQVRIAPRGGNDAGALHRARAGMPACSLSVPVRNIHSNVEVADKKDAAATVDLLCAVLKGGLDCLQPEEL